MKLAVVGSALAGGAVQIVDILLDQDIASDIRIYDDDPNAQGVNILGIPVVGPCDRIMSDMNDNLIDSAVIAVGSIAPREALFDRFSDSTLHFPNIVSSRAHISNSASLGVANVILPHVYIGPRVSLGSNNYITTSCDINHDTTIGSHCYFSTSVAIAGRVVIGDRVRLDTACCITADAKVKSDSLIGPGECFGPLRGH